MGTDSEPKVLVPLKLNRKQCGGRGPLDLKGRSRIRRLSLTEPSERFGLRAARSKSSDIRSLRQYAFKSLGSENLPFVVFPLTRTSQLMGRESESNMRHLLPNAMI